jgi:hypothetical protein
VRFSDLGMRLVSSRSNISTVLSVATRRGIIRDPRRKRNRLPAGPHVIFGLDGAQPDGALAAPEPIPDELLPGEVKRPPSSHEIFQDF